MTRTCAHLPALPPCPTCGGGVRKVRPGGVCHRCVPTAPAAPAGVTAPPVSPFAHLAGGPTDEDFDDLDDEMDDGMDFEALFEDLYADESGDPADTSAPAEVPVITDPSYVPATGERVKVETTSFGSRSDTTVTAGVLTPAAVHALMNGQCHALAAALHDETGWPILAVTTVNHAEQLRTGRPFDLARDGAHHVVVAAPDGILDAKGHRTLEDLLADLPDGDEHHLIPLTREQTLALGDGDYMVAPAVGVASTFVPTILAEQHLTGREPVTAPGPVRRVNRTLEDARTAYTAQLAADATTTARYVRRELTSLEQTKDELDARHARLTDPDPDYDSWDDADWDSSPRRVREQLGHVTTKIARAQARLAAAVALPGPFQHGQRVRVSPIAGLDSGRAGVVIPATHVPLTADGVPNITGHYQPADWDREAAVRFDDGTIALFDRSYLDAT